MEDTNTPRVLEQTKRSGLTIPFKWTEVAALAAIITALVGLGFYTTKHIRTNHEIDDAKRLSTQVVSALSKQSTSKLLTLGDKNFQTNNSASKLDSELTFKTTPPITFAAMYGDTKPTISQHTVLNNSRGRHVVFIYRYDKLKVPFYVRIDTIQPPHDSHWHLQALGADPNESNLTNPLPGGSSSV